MTTKTYEVTVRMDDQKPLMILREWSVDRKSEPKQMFAIPLDSSDLVIANLVKEFANLLVENRVRELSSFLEDLKDLTSGTSEKKGKK